MAIGGVEGAVNPQYILVFPRDDDNAERASESQTSIGAGANEVIFVFLEFASIQFFPERPAPR